MNKDMRPFYLYKFFEKEEYRKQFLDGVLFCNTARWFAKTEKQLTGVIDKFENAKIISISDDKHFVQHEFINCADGSVKVNFHTYDVKPANYRENQAFISYNREHYNLFCMSTIWVNENSVVTEFDKSNIHNFGEYGVLIFNMPKFFNIVYDSLSLNPTIKECYGGPINYISYNQRDCIQHWSIWNKFDNYKAQQEFRFVFNGSEGEILKYKLSQNLSCVAAIIPNKKEFYENINVGQNLFSTVKIPPKK